MQFWSPATETTLPRGRYAVRINSAKLFGPVPPHVGLGWFVLGLFQIPFTEVEEDSLADLA